MKDVASTSPKKLTRKTKSLLSLYYKTAKIKNIKRSVINIGNALFGPMRPSMLGVNLLVNKSKRIEHKYKVCIKCLKM